MPEQSKDVPADSAGTGGGTVLWWGRSDTDYSRNRIMRRCLVQAGCSMVDFRPRLSPLGDVEALLGRRGRVDLVWVPCFRQRDLAAARRWSARRGIPLVFDPLISAYDKQVYERRKLPPGGPRAGRLLARERRLFGMADRLIADTAAHAEFFETVLGVAADRIHVVPLCADEDLFTPSARTPDPAAGLEVLFFGSFIPLQGPEVIVEAARLYRGPPIRWRLVGDGPLRRACEARAAGIPNLRFEDWIPYSRLASRIAGADIVLGIFGDTPKAARVVPNKLCQALACARPVVTRASPAMPAGIGDPARSGITRVPAADPAALSEAVAGLAGAPAQLEAAGRRAHATYRRFFSADRVAAELARVLRSL